MGGILGKSGPPGNQNAFRHGLAAVQQRRVNGALTQEEQDIRTCILTGLLTDKGAAPGLIILCPKKIYVVSTVWRLMSLLCLYFA
jgi:hypothetical protein